MIPLFKVFERSHHYLQGENDLLGDPREDVVGGGEVGAVQAGGGAPPQERDLRRRQLSGFNLFTFGLVWFRGFAPTTSFLTFAFSLML